MDDDATRKSKVSQEEISKSEISWDDAMKGDPEQSNLEIGPMPPGFPSVAEGAELIEQRERPVPAEDLARKLVEDDQRRAEAKEHWAVGLSCEQHALAAREEGRDDLYLSFKEQAAQHRADAMAADPEYVDAVREAGVKVSDA